MQRKNAVGNAGRLAGTTSLHTSGSGGQSKGTAKSRSSLFPPCSFPPKPKARGCQLYPAAPTCPRGTHLVGSSICLDTLESTLENRSNPLKHLGKCKLDKTNGMWKRKQNFSYSFWI